MPRLRLAMVTGFVVLAAALPASAQVPYDTNIDFQQFRPAPGPYNFFTVQGSRVEGRTALTLGAWVNYANRPLTIFDANCPSVLNDTGCTTGDVRSRPIEHLATLNLQVGVTLANRILLTLDLPFTYETGEAVNRENGRRVPDSSGTPQSQSAVGMGDPRVEAKVRLAGSGLTGAGLAVSGFVTVPVGRYAGAGDHFIADSGVTFGGRLIGEYRRGRFSMALNVGANGRPNTLTVLSTQVGSRLTWGAAVGVDISPRLGVIAEGYGTSDLTSRLQNNNAEVLGGLRYHFRDLTITAGGGSGVLRGAGSPVGRAFVGVGWAPYRVDNDGDGVGDNVDRCPTEAEDLDGYEDDDGCPEVDDDQDGVPDGQDACPRDAAPRTPDGCPDRSVAHDIPDVEDRCPEVPVPNDDGCPQPSSAPPPAAPQAAARAPAAPVDDPDGDTFVGAEDKCPKEAETFDGKDDDDGCPEPPPKPGEKARKPLVEVVAGTLTPNGMLAFDKDDAVEPGAKPLLRALAAEVKKTPGAKLLVGARPSPARKEQAQKRAFAVVQSVRGYVGRESAVEVVEWDQVKGAPRADVYGIGLVLAR